MSLSVGLDCHAVAPIIPAEVGDECSIMAKSVIQRSIGVEASQGEVEIIRSRYDDLAVGLQCEVGCALPGAIAADIDSGSSTIAKAGIQRAIRVVACQGVAIGVPGHDDLAIRLDSDCRSPGGAVGKGYGDRATAPESWVKGAVAR